MNNSSNNTILNHLEKNTNTNNNKRLLENPISPLYSKSKDIRDLLDAKDFKEREKVTEKYPKEKYYKSKEIKESIFSVENICKTLKPMINNIIQTVERSDVKIRNRRINGSFCSVNSSSILKEKYINELVNEFEESRSKSRGSSKYSPKINSNIFPNSSNAFDKLSKTHNVNSNVIEKEEKPKRTLKEMFSKAFNFNQSQSNNNCNNNNINNNAKDVSKSRLAKMLQETNEDSSEVKKNNSSNNNNITKKENDPKSTPNTVLTDKNKNDIIVDLMNKIDKDIAGNNEISIRKAKLNNDSFIDLNDEDDNDNDNNDSNLFNNRVKNKNNKNDISSISIKEENKKIMKEIVFNVIIDNTGDDYECKTFYVKNENDIVNNNKNKNNNKEKDTKLNKSKDSTSNLNILLYKKYQIKIFFHFL
jgi:hypothetical protein